MSIRQLPPLRVFEREAFFLPAQFYLPIQLIENSVGRFWQDRRYQDGDDAQCIREMIETFGDERATLILAVLSDKDLKQICEALVPISDYVLLPKVRSERAADQNDLAQILSAITPSLPYTIASSIAEALNQARAKPNPILLTGSMHFAGEALAHLQGKPGAFEECAQ